MSIGSARAGWKGYLLTVVVGAAAVAAVWAAFELIGAAKFRAGRQQVQLQAAANARRIDAEYRRREQEVYVDFTRRLEDANDTICISNDERDCAFADVGGSLEDIDAERARATKAAANVGISEKALPEPGTFSNHARENISR